MKKETKGKIKELLFNKKAKEESPEERKKKAEIELGIYGLFFLALIVLIKVTSLSNDDINNKEKETNFLTEITDNYQYDMAITIDDNIYNYKGKVLGHNSTIEKTIGDIINTYYQKNDKYYLLDEKGNYILTNKEELYKEIEYTYLDIKNIKEYIKLGNKEDNTYKVNVSKIILNTNSIDDITINIDESNKNLTIDYTNLYKIDNPDTTKVLVEINFKNINNVLSLEE